MSKKIFTVFQNLDKAVSGNWVDQTSNNIGHNNSYDMSSNGGDIIYKAEKQYTHQGEGRHVLNWGGI